MKNPVNSNSRRTFLKQAGQLLVGFNLLPLAYCTPATGEQGLAAKALGERDDVDSWIRIGEDGRVTVLTGKMELVYEGEQEGAINVAKHIIGQAVSEVFKRTFPDPRSRQEDENPYSDILNWFKDGNDVILSDSMSEKEYRKTLDGIRGLSGIVDTFADKPGDGKYVLMDLILEALHQNSMLGKEDLDQTRSFSDMLGSMLGGMGGFDDDDDDEFEDFRGLN
jgi:hypothetical protein